VILIGESEKNQPILKKEINPTDSAAIKKLNYHAKNNNYAISI
jgi:hypothetical protein